MFDFSNRQNIPGVFGKDVGDEEIDFVGGVHDSAAVYGSEAIILTLPVSRPHGLDLNAPTDFFDAGNKVISLALIPGLSDGQSQAGGFAHEAEFGELPSLPVVKFGWVAGVIEKREFSQIWPQNTKSAVLGRALEII